MYFIDSRHELADICISCRLDALISRENSLKLFLSLKKSKGSFKMWSSKVSA